jgi:hypothetical protein
LVVLQEPLGQGLVDLGQLAPVFVELKAGFRSFLQFFSDEVLPRRGKTQGAIERRDVPKSIRGGVPYTPCPMRTAPWRAKAATAGPDAPILLVGKRVCRLLSAVIELDIEEETVHVGFQCCGSHEVL